MPARYFQGNSLQGPVKASTAANFREVVDALRICPSLAIARQAFLALPKERRNELKQVPFFVAACFKDSPSKRVKEQATTCNLIFLDIDTTKDGKSPAAPFVSNPASLYNALAGFNFAAYTTASSTPEKPRLRIVVDASAIPVSQYARAVSSLGKLLGLSEITPESRNAVQPMFLPTLFSDTGPDEHPLIAHRLDAGQYTPDDISTDLGDYSEPKQAQGELSSDALYFLRAPIPEITLGIAKEALGCIDADCSYFDWLECAAALKHQFSPHKAEEAFSLFDEWSEGGSKYGGQEETRAKWDSLRPTPIGRLPVTIRSLLRQAVASGWDDKRVKESCFNSLVKWLEEVGTVTELMEKGAHKILSAPLLSAVQEDVLVHQLCTQAKKRFAYTISATAIRKDMARAKAEIKAQEKPAEKVKEPQWAKGVCYIAAAQDFYRHRTGEKYKSESFNAIYSRWLLPTEEMLKDAGLQVTPATLSRPIVSPAEYALNHLKILTVYDYAYDPSQPTELFFVNQGRKYLNTYLPTYPELDKENAAEAGSLFQKHLSVLVAEPEYRRTITDYLAYMVQFPGRKIRWAPLVQSVEGAGKTYLAEMMKAVLGSEHVITISGDSIKSGYNDWAFGHQLIVLEEVRVAGANRKEIMNALKPLITNDDISINEKYRSARDVENISNYLMFSNHHDALALTPGDRRYFVIKSPLQHKAQVLALGPNYFPPLYAMLRDKPGAMRAYLADWELSPDFEPDGHAPRTKYVQELINDSANDLTAAVRKLLLEGDSPLIQYDIVSAKNLLDVLHLEENTRATAQQIAQVLREEGFRQVGRHSIGSERHYIWARGLIGDADAVATAQDRAKRGLKNLCMEILF
jgi:hypothetical protein